MRPSIPHLMLGCCEAHTTREKRRDSASRDDLAIAIVFTVHVTQKEKLFLAIVIHSHSPEQHHEQNLLVVESRTESRLKFGTIILHYITYLTLSSIAPI